MAAAGRAGRCHATVNRADWSSLPIADDSVDLVAADGSFACLSFPEGISSVLTELRRVLRPNGRLVTRVFLRRNRPETLEAIFADLQARRIGNPFSLKLRVGGALHNGGWAGYMLNQQWRLRQRWFPDLPAAAQRQGWAPKLLDMVGSFETNDVRFVYPTMHELLTVLARSFRVVAVSHGHYELAELCPTLELAPL